MIDLSTTLGNAWFPSPLFTASDALVRQGIGAIYRFT